MLSNDETQPKPRHVSDRALALRYLYKLNSLTLWLLIASVTINFYVKNIGLFSEDFGSDKLRQLSFNPADPTLFGGLALITSFFVHLNIGHLLNNYIILLPVGLYLEKKVGRFKYARLIIASHAITLLTYLCLFKIFDGLPQTRSHYLFGSSSATFACVAYFLLLTRSVKLYFSVLAIYLAFIFVSGEDQVSHLTHIIGWFLGTIIFKLRRKL